MGTNYYLHQKPDCECCGRPFEPLHIGKSSGGWCFGLHVNPEEGISTLDDWRKLWAAPGAYIRDEYGQRISVEEMELTITARKSHKDWSDPKWWQGFYRSEQDFHDKNHSERGPNGLLRHRIGPYCKAHGDGTWDCLNVEFS
jgi:hypothetical protein